MFADSLSPVPALAPAPAPASTPSPDSTSAVSVIANLPDVSFSPSSL
jgi:hypothetical protein